MDQIRIVFANLSFTSVKYAADIISGHFVHPSVSERIEYQILRNLVWMVFFTVTFKLAPYFLG